MEITKKTHAPHTKYLIAPTPHTLVEIRPSRPSNRSHRLPPPPYDGHFRWHRSNGTAFDFRVRVMGGGMQMPQRMFRSLKGGASGFF